MVNPIRSKIKFKSTKKLNFYNESRSRPSKLNIEDSIINISVYKSMKLNLNNIEQAQELENIESYFSDLAVNTTWSSHKIISSPVSNSISRLQNLISPYSNWNKRRNLSIYKDPSSWELNSSNFVTSPISKVIY